MEYELNHDKLPDHGTVYFKAHNKTLKGHFRGLVRGLITGMVFGALVGVGLFALSSVLFPTIGISTSIIAGLAALGSIMGGELMGHIGTSAGTVSANLAEKELRLRYPSLPQVGPDSPEPGVGYHSEIPPDRDRGKFYHLRSGLMGTLLGLTVGSLFGIGGLTEHLFSHSALEALKGIFGTAFSSLPAIAGASFGAFFGFDRSIFKSIFNTTDNLFQGRLGGPSEEQIAKGKQRYQTIDPNNPPEITSLQRQEEFYRLQNGYFKEAFKAGFAGNARGLLAGLVSGTLVGLTIGAGLVFVLPLVGIPGISSGLLVGGAMALGAGITSRIFAKNTAEPALHAAADEIFEERVEALKEGRDIGFSLAEEKVSAKHRQNPEMESPEASDDKRWFNPRIMLTGGLAGALIGAVLAPVTGGLLLHLGHAAILEGAAHAGAALLSAKVAVTSTALGLMGSVFGLGSRVTNLLNDIGDYLYLGTLSPEKHPDIRTSEKPPLLESNSPLLPEKPCRTAVPVHHSSLSEQSRASEKPTQNASTHDAAQAYLQEILQRKKDDAQSRKLQASKNFRNRISQEAETDQAVSVAM